MRTTLHTLMAITAIIVTSLAFAGDVPTRNWIAASSNESTSIFTVPNFGNGSLVRIRLYDTSSASATCTVKQIVAPTSTRSLTNTLFTMTASSSSATVDAGVNATNGPLAYLVPGDILQFLMTGVDTGKVHITRMVSSP